MGEGVITGNLTNNGVLQPGRYGVGQLTINGTLVSANALPLDIYSPTYSDKLIVNGTFNVGGVISIIESYGFTPAVGDTIDVMDVTNFVDNGYTLDLTGAPLPSGLRWDVTQFASDGTIRVVAGQTGDFNADGKVDAADFVMWRKGLRATYTADDYATWRAQFGTSLSTGSELDGSQVPEPATVAFVFVGAIGLGLRRRRHISLS
jgi:hypothetical protein